MRETSALCTSFLWVFFAGSKVPKRQILLWSDLCLEHISVLVPFLYSLVALSCFYDGGYRPSSSPPFIPPFTFHDRKGSEWRGRPKETRK